MLFGVLFLKRTILVPVSAFVQVDATHWTLDVSTLAALVGGYGEVKDVVLVLGSPGLLPPGAGLALHVQAGASGWEYRGAVCDTTPSESFPTAWPRAEGDAYAPTAQLGVSLEPLAELAQREATAVASKQEFARRVATDLFRFIESFPTTPDGSFVVGSNTLEAWYSKFSHRFTRDPDFLLRQAAAPL